MKVAFFRVADEDARWVGFPSMAEASIRAYCEHELDFPLEWEHCSTIEDVESTDADVVAIGSVTNMWDIARGAIQTSKDRGKFVVVGGPHVTAMPDPNCVADTQVVGEGEIAMANILNTIHDGFPSHVSSVIAGTPISLAKHGWLPMGVTRAPGAVSAVVSRGCPYRCTFCSASSLNTPRRSFNPIDIGGWCRDNVPEGGTVSFYDLMLTGSLGWLQDFVEELINAGAGSKWRVGHLASRTNLITDDLHEILKPLKLDHIGVGMETASQRILDKLKPNCHVEDHERAAMLAYKHGVELKAMFIIGTPGETEEDLQMTYDFIDRWQGKYFDRGGVYVLTPYPGTYWWDYARENGLISDPIDWSSFRCSIGGGDPMWDGITYMNGEVMPKAKAIEWGHRIFDLCGRRNSGEINPSGIRG